MRRMMQTKVGFRSSLLGFSSALAAALCASALAFAAEQPVQVGHAGDRVILPVNQVLTPYGRQVELSGTRPIVMALSPDRRFLAVSGKRSKLLVIRPTTGEILQEVPFPSEKQKTPPPPSQHILNPDTKGQASYTGLAFSPDGRRIYLSNVNGSVKVFTVDEKDVVRPSHSIVLPPAKAPRRAAEIPAGIAVSPDGKRLYVCGNLSNRLLEIDAASGKVLRTFETGVAPYDVALVNGKAYVSNWGGRRPKPGELTGPAGRGTTVKVDPVRHIACEGSVTVINLAQESGAAKEILTGLHASALAVSPDKRYLVCANAAADNLSVIDTRTDQVVETIWAKQSPADLFGASPNGLCFSPDGERLYVANGTQNAVAVIEFEPPEAPGAKTEERSELLGLIPVGWFPCVVIHDPEAPRLYVANLKGLALAPRSTGLPTPKGFNTHQYHGSISVFRIPSDQKLKELSAQVYADFSRSRIAQSFLPPRPNQPPRPIPERIGEPSVIRHVVYVIKENRTYDQVLGDMPEGNGDPGLCIFGERVTPNEHKLAREFVLLDNTYCCGILSADGHQWSTTAFGTDYLEKSFAGWPRSYPDGMGIDDRDALAYAPSGFIWDNALAHNVSIWNFGEFAMPDCRWADPKRSGSPSWTDFWHEYLYGEGKVIIGSQPAIETIRPFTPTDYVGWNMAVPDVWRARYIIRQLHKWEKEGRMPRLVLICLPDDHTSGTARGRPTPAAHVADNDLALGRIIEAFSHSRFWKETAFFVIEDDPQNGFDHVSGYRTTAFIASPWCKRRAVISTMYNTTSMLRTIEQILGLPPMNQFDATAEPMRDCFTDTPDFTPFVSVPNQVPLDQMNPAPHAIKDPRQRRWAEVSETLNFKQVDACPESTLNQILWHAMKGPNAPYPWWAVTLDQEEDED